MMRKRLLPNRSQPPRTATRPFNSSSCDLPIVGEKIYPMSTMAITAADVNKLRQITGAGMMDCKKALTEANGDFDAAIDILRKQGQKVAAKRADRDATEGLVIAKTSADNTRGVLVCVNCETDFVA